MRHPRFSSRWVWWAAGVKEKCMMGLICFFFYRLVWRPAGSRRHTHATDSTIYPHHRSRCGFFSLSFPPQCPQVQLYDSPSLTFGRSALTAFDESGHFGERSVCPPPVLLRLGLWLLFSRCAVSDLLSAGRTEGGAGGGGGRKVVSGRGCLRRPRSPGCQRPRCKQMAAVFFPRFTCSHPSVTVTGPSGRCQTLAVSQEQ